MIDDQLDAEVDMWLWRVAVGAIIAFVVLYFVIVRA